MFVYKKIKILEIICNCNNKERNYIVFLLIFAITTYLALQVNYVTKFYYLELYNIELLDKKYIYSFIEQQLLIVLAKFALIYFVRLLLFL